MKTINWNAETNTAPSVKWRGAIQVDDGATDTEIDALVGGDVGSSLSWTWAPASQAQEIMDMTPEGRLTLVPGSPILSADATASSISYSPRSGGGWPIWDGTRWTRQSFLSGPTDQNGPSLSIAGLAVGSYHVFGSATGLVLGAAWGSANPQSLLTRLDGRQVDPATSNPWLGSINVRTPGSLTCHLSGGLARRFDVYNAHQKTDISLRMTPAQAQYCPTTQYPNFLPFNNDAVNSSAFAFTGDYEKVDCVYNQIMFINTSGGPYGIVCAVGWNGAYAGNWIIFSNDMTTIAAGMTGSAHHINPAAIGSNSVSMLVSAAVNSASRQSAIWGSAPGYNPHDVNSLLTVSYRG